MEEISFSDVRYNKYHPKFMITTGLSKLKNAYDRFRTKNRVFRFVGSKIYKGHGDPSRRKFVANGRALS